MLKRSTNALVLFVMMFTSGVGAQTAPSIHDLDEFPAFSSTADITNFFAKAETPIKILELKHFSTNNFIVTAYPYTGVATIDVFHFVKYGDRWKTKMVLFYLRPKYRRLNVEETKAKIILLDLNEELLQLTVDQTLNSVER